jgi:hypothetical protein
MQALYTSTRRDFKNLPLRFRRSPQSTSTPPTLKMSSPSHRRQRSSKSNTPRRSSQRNVPSSPPDLAAAQLQSEAAVSSPLRTQEDGETTPRASGLLGGKYLDIQPAHSYANLYRIIPDQICLEFQPWTWIYKPSTISSTRSTQRKQRPLRTLFPISRPRLLYKQHQTRRHQF